MRIKQITWQHRNDFDALMECEHCESTQELKSGYNDVYYHQKVIPSITCTSCKKNRAGESKIENPNGTVSV